MISIVKTKGKAGYLVCKLAGGHGDHEISLPLDSIGDEAFLSFLDSDFLVANPLLILI